MTTLHHCLQVSTTTFASTTDRHLAWNRNNEDYTVTGNESCSLGIGSHLKSEYAYIDIDIDIDVYWWIYG